VKSAARAGNTTASTSTEREGHIELGPVELIDLVFELAGNSGRTTLSAINKAGCRRDASFSSRQFGNQKLSKMLGRLGLFDVIPVKNSRGIRDYAVIPARTPDTMVNEPQVDIG
jgi:hypothetical protein